MSTLFSRFVNRVFGSSTLAPQGAEAFAAPRGEGASLAVAAHQPRTLARAPTVATDATAVGLLERSEAAAHSGAPGSAGATAQVKARAALAVAALDDLTDRQLRGRHDTEGWRDRYDYDREQVLRDALRAWRTNPLARRIVGLTTQYVVGGGVTLNCEHAGTHAFLRAWWHHRLNRLPVRAYELCDELTRSGELFIGLTTDAGGMSYVRAIPAADIAEIETAENDMEQAVAFVEKAQPGEQEGRRWRAFAANDVSLKADRVSSVKDQVSGDSDMTLDTGQPDTTEGLPPVMLHYAINRPVGAKHGESDLAPILRWLARYAGWLEDRARLNHWRQVFLYIVTGKYPDQAAKQRRQAELNANPPSPGTLLVADESEKWDVLSPKLDSFEAREDGLALKKMIAAGAAIPLHNLAEPESATRTTAESSSQPTFRHYQQRQIFFLWLLGDLARAAVRRRAAVDRSVDPDAAVTVTGTDISSRDNETLSAAAGRIVEAFGTLYDRGLVDEEEFLRLAYTFAGEMVDVPSLMKRVVEPRVR